MKKLFLILSIVVFGFSFSFAQTEENQVDIQQFKKEIEEKMDAFELDFNSAMKEMQDAMGNMMFESDGNIIINGDTIIVAPGGELPNGIENFGELFKQIPESNGEGFQFFFGNEDMAGFSEMFEKLKGQLGNAFDFEDFPIEEFENREELSPKNKSKTPEKKKEKPLKKGKKKKTYTL